MGLGLYLSTNEDDLITAVNPFTVTFNGSIGGAQDRQIFIRNNDRTRWYNNITLSVVDSVAPDTTNNSVDGYFWKLAQKDTPLTNDEWLVVSPANSISIPDNIGSASYPDTATYISVWVRVQVPRNQPATTIKDISFLLEATEHLI